MLSITRGYDVHLDSQVERATDREFTIAEARRHFSDIVREAERGSPVRLTRRGKGVAVVVSETLYRTLSAKRQPDLWNAIQEYRAAAEAVDLSDDEVASWRDRGSGREFSWQP